jgi:TRAP transporter TAXI family solute receptor
VRELAHALRQPSSTVHRLLQVLRDEGLLDWDAKREEYRAGMELHRWSAVLRQRLRVAEVARPVMDRLVGQLGESCWLGLYDASRKRHVYVSEVRTQQALTYDAPIGIEQPLWATAGGWATLAFLSDAEQKEQLARAKSEASTALDLTLIRSRGYAILGGEQPGAPVSLAAPVFDSGNAPAASLTVVAPAFRLSEHLLHAVGATVAEQARQLSQVLGAQLLGVAAGAGAWHEAANALGVIVQRGVPGVGATAWSAGGEKLLDDVQDGRGGYCLAVAGSLVRAYAGEAPFERAHDRLRYMISLFPLYLHIVARREGRIRSFNDLLTARVSAGERDFTTTRVVSRLLQLARGEQGAPKLNDPHLVYLDYAEANRQFIKGGLDAVISLTSLRDPAYRELASRLPIRLIPLTEKLVSAYVGSSKAYEPGMIPGGTYSSWDSEVPTLAVPTVLVTSSERPEEEVYKVTRAVFEAAEELSRLSESFSEFKSDFAFRNISAPLHSGARRYWSERGKQLPDETGARPIAGVSRKRSPSSARRTLRRPPSKG